MDNNNVNIKNIGFSVLNQPLKLYGTVSNDAVSDLHLTATDLSLKGLLVAAGQAALMKENQINSGSVSMKADIQGNLDKINPVINLVLNNINISNLPSNTKLIAPSTTVSINGIALSGEAKSSNVSVINPCAKVSLPSLTAQIQEKEIVIPQTSVKIEDINVNVSGKIKNYLTENIGLEFVTTGDIKSALAGDINLVKQILNLNYSTTDSSTIIIPMFDKSKMSFTGNLGITGSMLNPMLKGNISIPTLSIPEIPVSMTNLDIKLNGNILNGTGSVQKFVSGGIEAENLTSDFSLKGENFYLKNLKGTAFDGKISGNIIYNIINAKTHVTFLGTGLNAEKAVAGAVGIKNALSGILGFDTDLTLIAADYNDMMKSLNGKLKFDVKNGAFGSIGRMDKFLHANNIMTNAVLKTTVSTLTSGTTLADTAKFEYIEGNLDFANGWANINPVKSSGKSLSYYVTGKYNLINGTANVSILGRLDSQIIAKLGIIGQLSADKLLSYIPIFGTTTANIVKALTSDPKSENISAIPALSSGTASYKDFKVVFNGGLESTSSVKSFKWLTDVDMTAIETKTVKESITDIKKSVTQDYKNTVQGVKDTITNSKEQWQATKDDFYATKDQIKNSADEIINLFKKKSPAEK